MYRRVLGAWCILLILSSGLPAMEAVGTIKKVDADKGIIIFRANGQDRTLKADKNLKVLDAKGKDLADRLKSKELKEGAVVTVTVERENDEIILKVLQLGKKQGGAPPQPDGPPLQSKNSVGLIPLTEMTAQVKYKGEDGGLYGGGHNEPPAAHLAAAKRATAQIVPLDAQGKPAKVTGKPARDPKIVLISISMSNATAEFSTFKRIADANHDKSPLLTIVDCAQGGGTMARWAQPDDERWKVAESRLKDAGVTDKQVQVAWIKLANAGPTGKLAQHGKQLQTDTEAVIHNLKARYPHLRVAYLASRIYGGYATRPLNPEPYAYEGAFVVRWLIRDQIKGNPGLNYDNGTGTVKAPVLLWGPYFWADGTKARKSDGLVWNREDLAEDGTHPAASGQQKVASMLLKFFKTDALAKTWFVKH
jgi:hypothetical protein